MKRLVIKHGGRITRHELGSEPIVIGRDPNCSLFFADERLSRRHARIVATPAGARLEDLGSRNGSFVNSEKVESAELEPGDTIKIGNLTVSFQDDSPPPPPPPSAEVPERGNDDEPEPAEPVGPAEPDEPDEEDDGDESTIMLPGTSPIVAEAKEAASSAPEPPPEPPPEPDPEPPDDKTVVLGAFSPPTEDAPRPPAKTPVLSEAIQKKLDTAKTAILPSPPLAFDDKTEVFDSKALGAAPQHSDTMILDQAPLSAPGARSPQAPAIPAAPSPGPAAERPPSGFLPGLPWSAKYLLISTVLVLVVYVLLAFPLMSTMGSELRDESLRRARMILALTAASTQNQVGEGEIRDVSVENILREERVKEALIVDLDGNVLAPSSRADETLSEIPGIDTPIADIRTYFLGRRGSDYVLVQPLLYQSRRVGLAVIVYEVATASGGWAMAVLFIAFLIAALGILVALVLGKKMTLEPISVVTDDVEAVIKGDAATVPTTQGIEELSVLARSINRLISRVAPSAEPARPARPLEGPSQTTSPLVVPRSAPAPAAPPPGGAPAPAAETSDRTELHAGPPALVKPEAAEGAALFWVDENFIVMRAEDAAASLVGLAAEAMEGKHLIEAVSDQKLLEGVLDAINGLEREASSTVEARRETGLSMEVTASRDQGGIVVGLREL